MKKTIGLLLLSIVSILLLMSCPQPTGDANNNNGTNEEYLSRPIITPNDTFFDSGDVQVTIASRDEGVKLFYTLDGKTPTASSKEYKAPFSVTVEKGKKVTVMAIAIKGDLQSSTTTQTFQHIDDKLSLGAPVFSVTDAEGNAITLDSLTEYVANESEPTVVNVDLSTEDTGATIYYTLNGAAPTKDSEQFTAPLQLNLEENSYVIQAIAIKRNTTDSIIVSLSLSKEGAPKAPVITTTLADFYDANLERTPSAPTLAVEEQTDVIFTYSTDDGETFSGDVPSLVIPPEGGSVTVHVQATKDGFTFYPTSSATFTINTTPLAAPTITSSGFYDANEDKQDAKVTISGADDATFFYTISGENQPPKKYTTPITITFPEGVSERDFHVTAFARKIGETESVVKEETIAFEKRTLAKPVIETDASDFNVGGTIQAEVPLNITMSDTNATVYYKIDAGSEKVYNASAKPMIPYKNGNTVITARATRDGYISSTAEQRTITLQGEALTVKPVIYTVKESFYTDSGTAVSVPLNITLSEPDSGVEIWYSIDGGAQTQYNALEKPSLTMEGRNSDIELRAYARKLGFVDSKAEETFNIRTLTLSTTFTGSDHSQEVLITKDKGVTYEVSANNVDYVKQLIPSVKLIHVLTYADFTMDSQHRIQLKVRASRPGYVSKTNTHYMTPPKVYHVKPGYNSNENGSSTATFENLQKAVDIITKINDGSSTYTINVTGDITKEGAVSAGVNKKDNGMVEIEADDNTTLKLNIVGIGSQPSKINARAEFDSTTGAITTSGLGKRVMYISGDRVSVTLQNITLTGGSTTSGGGLYIESGELTLNEDAEINKNRATNGGGIYMQGGTVNLSGGDGLYNNLATESGGGVYLSGGNFNFSDGNIRNSKALGTGETEGGGGVYIGGTNQSPTSFTMTGGLITYNSAKSNGGGILHASSNSTFRLDGNASIGAGDNTLLDGTANSIELLVSGNGIDIGNITYTIYITAPYGATLAKNVTTADKSKINIQDRAAGSYTLSYYGGKIGLGNATQRYRVENGRYYYLERYEGQEWINSQPVPMWVFSSGEADDRTTFMENYDDIDAARNGYQLNGMSYPSYETTWLLNDDDRVRLYSFETGNIEGIVRGEHSICKIKSERF